MNELFYPHNTHIHGLVEYKKLDPHLAKLAKQSLVYHPDLLNHLPSHEPGIYSLVGGRQIGKSTLLKQWIFALLEQGIPPQNIYFYSGELIIDHLQLIEVLQNDLKKIQPSKVVNLQFRIIDEVTYIKDWDKGIKYLADLGLFQNVVLIVSGSDSSLIYEAIKRFPGRRGRAAQVDFHYFPLSFRQSCELKKIQVESPKSDLEKQKWHEVLGNAFHNFLKHGGYLTAMNDMVTYGYIQEATYRTYSDWIRGDFLKRRKSENYLKAVVDGIIKRYASQISWVFLAKELPIDHHQTIIDYVELLKIMDVVIVQEALDEGKLRPSPKKAKKIYFFDPFIFHAINRWTNNQQSPNESLLVEGVAVSHFARKFPTYYIKSEGEVDIAYLDKKRKDRFIPIEIKWTQQIREKDLKQILKYPNGQIWGKFATDKIGFLPEKLLEIEQL